MLHYPNYPVAWVLRTVPSCSRSIFTGATKSEILHYLQDARLRIGGGSSSLLQSPSDPSGSDPVYPAASSDPSYPSPEHNAFSAAEELLYAGENIYLGQRNIKHRISAVSNLSDSSNSSNDR
jgi:hypothetical protein